MGELGGESARDLRAAQRDLDRDDAVELALDGRRPQEEDEAAPVRLTPRERDVVKLIAEGRNNRAIADQLVLSVRAVDGHVERILAKLDASSRTQIATWVHSHDLV